MGQVSVRPIALVVSGPDLRARRMVGANSPYRNIAAELLLRQGEVKSTGPNTLTLKAASEKKSADES